MSPQESATLNAIDATYEAFCAALPPRIGRLARRLALDLGLAITPQVPWSRCFPDAVVLGLPRLLVEGHEGETERSILGAAAVAHMLAIVGAYGQARVDDGTASSTVSSVLEVTRRARDQALARLTDRVGQARDFAWAEAEVMRAQAEGQEVFAAGERVDLERYLRVALQRRALVFPASQAMAAAAGWGARDRVKVHAAIEAAALGLQIREDVSLWMDDELRGGSWAVVVAGRRRPGGSIVALQRRLAAEGRLCALLRIAADAFRRSADAAAALGAVGFASWGSSQALLTEGLAEDEAAVPGATVRWEQERRRRREGARSAA